VKYRDTNKWFLIDFEFACYAPSNTKEKRLLRDFHAPEINEGCHDTPVDIWSVGNLVSGYSLKLPSEIKLFAEKLKASPQDRPRARDALLEARKLYEKVKDQSHTDIDT
jgi:hypothetical protein